jgi:hypothetical protein
MRAANEPVNVRSPFAAAAAAVVTIAAVFHTFLLPFDCCGRSKTRFEECRFGAVFPRPVRNSLSVLVRAQYATVAKEREVPRRPRDVRGRVGQSRRGLQREAIAHVRHYTQRQRVTGTGIQSLSTKR